MPSDATPHQPTPDTMTFGQRVKRARVRSGKTRAYVADVMGHSVEWVKGIETDRFKMPGLPKLLRLARALGVEDITELTGDDRITAATYTKAEHQQLPRLRQALTSYQLRPADRERSAVLGGAGKALG